MNFIQGVYSERTPKTVMLVLLLVCPYLYSFLFVIQHGENYHVQENPVCAVLS